MRIGVNTFSVKNLFSNDFDKTLQNLKNIGFTSLEVCVHFGKKSSNLLDIPDEVRKQIQQIRGGIWLIEEAEERFPVIRKTGLEIDCVHAILDYSTKEDLIKQLPLLESFAEKNHIKYYVLGLQKNLEETKEFAPVLSQMAEAMHMKGITLAYHNHSEECITTDGVSPLEYLLDNCPKLMVEPDVGWMYNAKMSPVSFIKKYAERIVLLHLKDINYVGDENAKKIIFTAIGKGCVPMDEVLNLANICNLTRNGLVIDQDDSQDDILKDLASGIEFISRFI